MEDETRRIAGRYRVLAKLGSGGMGVVWQAFDETLRREVAVKELHFPVTLSDEDRDMLTARAMSEARNAARLHHPNIVAVHDVVSDDDQRPCIVMQLVVGQTLVQAVAADGALSPVRAAEVGLALLDALATAHAAGIVHRDVKPSNVLLSDSGAVLLSDFSIAVAAGDVGLTQTGILVGTPGYVSPERINTGVSGPPADLFGLGATLYFAVEGAGPFDNPEPVAALFAAATKEAPFSVRAGALRPVLDGLLVKEPAHRWTIDQARSALRSVIEHSERPWSRQPEPAPPPIAESPTTQLAATRSVTAPAPGSGRRWAWLAAAVVIVLVAAAVVVLHWPDPGHTTDAAGPPPVPIPQDVLIDYAGTAPAPAAAVPGSRLGGVVTILRDEPFAHLDPARIDSYDEMSVLSLTQRTLTGYLTQSVNGPPHLVGDLATNAGETTDGGRTWTYHLRTGIAFSDGTPITSADIAYGISRAFNPAYDSGFDYLRDFLDPRHVYSGPTANQPLAPGLSTPDEHTIGFSFDRPVMTLPFLVALATTAPVPKSRDTRLSYDRQWVSSGPYLLKEARDYSAGKLTLRRNPFWRANSDPIRTAYPESFVFDFNGANKANRIVNGTGGDATAVLTGRVTPPMIGVVKANTDAVRRVWQAPGPYLRYVAINVARVPDLKVRQALNYAINRDDVVNLAGGPDIATPATTILSPAIPGYRSFDVYPAGPKGDPSTARTLLAGVSIGPLTLCFAGGSDDLAHSVEHSFESAGLTVDTRSYPPDAFYRTIAAADTTCDLMLVVWGADYPDGYATLAELLDGALVGDPRANNYPHIDQPAINDRLRELLSTADRSQAATGYGELDEMIMRDFAPVVPIVSYRVFEVFGRNVGNASLNPLSGTISLTGVYVTT